MPEDDVRSRGKAWQEEIKDGAEICTTGAVITAGACRVIVAEAIEGQDEHTKADPEAQAALKLELLFSIILPLNPNNCLRLLVCCTT